MAMRSGSIRRNIRRGARVWWATIVVVMCLVSFLWGYLVNRMEYPPYTGVESVVTSVARFAKKLERNVRERRRTARTSALPMMELPSAQTGAS